LGYEITKNEGTRLADAIKNLGKRQSVTTSGEADV
jgi:hypothetical protein